ncbi:MAG: S1/P1 nuclease [Pyrinomonadaceae bacterium]
MNAQTIRVFLLLAAITAALSTPALAWNDVGHKITAYIAWQQMTPDVRERVIKILLESPEDAQLSTFYVPQGGRSDEAVRREFFMLASTWADIVRDRKFANRYKKYHHSNWHYSDTFWRVGADGKIEFLPAPDEGGLAVEKMQDFAKQLAAANVPDAQKAIAIAWLEHLIGDIHQPLHASARVTDLEPKGDQGGNLFLLTPKGTPRDKQENLHWFWDSIVVRYSPRKNDAADADYVDPIARQIMKRYPPARFQATLKAGDFQAWQKESLDRAIKDVFTADLRRGEMPSRAYTKRAFQTAEERLALAGYRMAAVLNGALAKQQ